jgi:hypothetical protein
MTIKERPLLMKGPLVVSTRAGLKTETRRVVKFKPPFESHNSWKYVGQLKDSSWMFTDKTPVKNWPDVFPGSYLEGGGRLCPYGKAGDRLWVRETHARIPGMIGAHVVHYMADGPIPSISERHDAGLLRTFPSIHMPRWASRLLLEITEIRLERVQDITEDGARAEGIILRASPEGKGIINVGDKYGPLQYVPPRAPDEDIQEVLRRAFKYVPHFAALWDEINAKRGYGWDKNPYVWVIVYKVLEGAECISQ